MINNSVYILCKQDGVKITRMHICTWNVKNQISFTEYGFEIDRGTLKKLDLLVALPEINKKEDLRCLYRNVSDTKNCRFIFNSDIEFTRPINGNAEFGVNISLLGDREIAILPIDSDKVILENKNLKLELEIPEQAKKIIYIRFLVESNIPAFAYVKNEISKRIITYDVRVNECRTASKDVIKEQKQGYKILHIDNCFCFHIVPSTYNIDFINGNKLKTIRSLEIPEFKNYLGDIEKDEKLTLKENQFNIIFCKQENKDNYSFFSTYSEEYIGNAQLTLALGANILCSLLFASGGLQKRTNDLESPFIARIPFEYWIALGVLLILGLYLIIKKYKR